MVDTTRIWIYFKKRKKIKSQYYSQNTTTFYLYVVLFHVWMGWGYNWGGLGAKIASENGCPPCYRHFHNSYQSTSNMAVAEQKLQTQLDSQSIASWRDELRARSVLQHQAKEMIRSATLEVASSRTPHFGNSQQYVGSFGEIGKGNCFSVYLPFPLPFIFFFGGFLPQSKLFFFSLADVVKQ